MTDITNSSAASSAASSASSTATKVSSYASSAASSAANSVTKPATIAKATTDAKTVTLKSGDQLWRVATDAGISLETLVELNGLKDFSVKPGKVLQLP